MFRPFRAKIFIYLIPRAGCRPGLSSVSPLGFRRNIYIHHPM